MTQRRPRPGTRTLPRLIAAVALVIVSGQYGCGDCGGAGGLLPVGDGGPVDARPSMDAPASDAPGARDSGPRRDAAGLPSIRGTITQAPSGVPIPAARVTVVAADGTFFDEVRSAPDGTYEVVGVDAGDYRVGASVFGRAFAEMAVTVSTVDVRVDLALGTETEQGRWTVIGDTEPERPAGTPSATLLPDGRVFYCHDTQTPVIFNPATGTKDFPPASPSSQGCHMQTVLGDGRLIFVGGQAREEPAAFTEAVAIVKLYDPVANTWEVLPDLNEQRWYPTLVRLTDERLLACGGGQRPDARRTAECEVFDPGTQRWTRTGPLGQPTEYSPSALLFTGEVLTTWSPPQLYNPTTGTWRNTGDFVRPARGFPDHSDHTLIMLPGGDAIAVGVKAPVSGAMVERYDVAAGTWRAGASPTNVRSRPEVLMLPDGRVLAAGGRLERGTATTNPWNQVAVADLYDPDADTWRGVAPMAMAREYHAMTLLVPDGRVLTTSGTGDQASGPAPEASVEAFEPPYLFRGPRPQLTALSTTDLRNGAPLTFRAGNTRAPTALVLIGTMAVTHWMDGGVPRLVRLPVTMTGEMGRADIPADPLRAPPGWYIAFLMVDDIPSPGIIVRVVR